MNPITHILMLCQFLAMYTIAADPPLWKIYNTAGVEPKEEWVIHDPSRIMRKGKKQMIATTGKAQEDGYDCGIETWWRKKQNKGKWKPGQCLLQEKPSWVGEYTSNDGKFDKQYKMINVFQGRLINPCFFGCDRSILVSLLQT